jgi:hypothetical protein
MRDAVKLCFALCGVLAMFLGSFTATWIKLDGQSWPNQLDALPGKERKLASMAVAASTNAVGVGCLQVSATKTLDLSSATCADSNVCPDCFFIDGAYTLTLSNCHTSKWTSSVAMGAGSVSTAVRGYTFINIGTSTVATISDGTNTYAIPSKGSIVAYCYTGLSSTLHFPYNPSSNGCPSACDAASPTDISGTAFSTVKFPLAATMTKLETWDTDKAGGGYCPRGCDDATPNYGSGTAFSTTSILSSDCSTTITDTTDTGTASTTGSVCVTR